MNTTSAQTWLIWLIAIVAAAAAVCLFVLHRWAARIAVLAAAAMLLIGAIAVRSQIGDLARESPRALCTGGVSWFGITLTGPDEICVDYR
ncbi:hypothetical protein GIS00_18910 [Nakamurella sp. YIM 132087]|uniref:Uncharacterized protein n=1 Tax=Nakamurella alba TaxID=2665158 RepID=A0A7K1FPE2_9ACTN|nr:hypothetical protein [Nakamurella alba]MTD16011.1 hypothetical protein [Nakamurella alba]